MGGKMKINDIPDDMTKEQFMEGMVRLELYKESHKRLCEWFEFHTQLFQSEDRKPTVIVNAAIQMLSGMLVRGFLRVFDRQKRQRKLPECSQKNMRVTNEKDAPSRHRGAVSWQQGQRTLGNVRRNIR
jgi:hypothetical protein